jgi:proteic killer suppression protein
MIGSFGDKATSDLYHGESGKRALRIPPDVRRVAIRKLDMIEFAHVLQDLSVPPANRLEALKGTLKGQYSIRINDQWRVTFRWQDGIAFDVTVTDYH